MGRSAESKRARVESGASSGATGPPDRFRIGLIAWVALLLLGCLVIRGAAAVNVVIDIDEFHFLHSAWMVGHGYLPYRDFWTNHSPLFIYLLKPLVALYDEDLSLFPVARLLNLVIVLGLIGLVAAIAARQRSRTAGILAALVLAANLVTFMPTVTLRHDPLTVICELVALVLLARGLRSGQLRESLAAGAALGLALALSPKGLFGLSGLLLGGFVHVASAPQVDRRQTLIRSSRLLGSALIGSLGTFAFILALLLPFDVWPRMVEGVFLESLLSPERFSPLTAYLVREIGTEPIVWLVMVCGFGVAARRWWVEPMHRDPGETLLLVAGLWFGLTYLLLMPSPYRQSALPFVAVGSIFGGRALALGAAEVAGATSRTKGIAWAACLIAIATWMVGGSARTILREQTPFRRMNAQQMEMIRYVLSLTGPQDAVFDADAAYVFRPQASFYGSLMSTVRLRIQRDELDFDIPERCERLACKVVITGSRVVRLPQKVQAWMRDNYTPSLLFPRVLLHNSLVPGEGGSGGQPRRVNGRR